MSTQSITKWAIDPTHSEIGFKAKHLMMTTVSGKFEKFTGTAETEGEDFSNAKVELTIETASVNTTNEQRDGHLKSGDFFDAAKFPQLKFVSTGVNKTGDKKFELNGNLTIKDVTQPVKLEVEYHGVMKDPWGNIKAGFSVTGTIKRKEWGLNWNATLETGGLLVSEDIKINCEVQFAKQA